MKKILSVLLAAEIFGTTAFAQDTLSSEKIAWGLGPQTDTVGRPVDAVNAQSEYGEYHALFVGEPDKKNIWLTFDEGYENGCTSRILDILKEKDAKAVFFVTYDYAKDNPELIKRMIAEGHTVGNHTTTHPSLAECSEEKIRDELSTLHDYVRDNFGYDMYVMRPPKGEFSEKVLSAAKDFGYTTVLWSFAYQDWLTDKQPDAMQAYERITSKAHSGEVCLLHAVSETNTAILGSVIDNWRENGFVVTPM